jgi:hypothetical protein
MRNSDRVRPPCLLLSSLAITACVAFSTAGASAHPLSAQSWSVRRERAAHAPHAYAQPFSVTSGDATYYPVAFDGHVHTRHSPDAITDPHVVLDIAQRIGLNAVIFTDHGSTRAASEGIGHAVASAPGQEIGGQFGHAVMWNTQERDSTRDAFHVSLAERAEFAHSRGGLIVLAHPGWWIAGNKRDPLGWMLPEALQGRGVSTAIDAIEIWNGVYSAPTRKLIDAWTRLLDLGIYVPIVGNSDFHNARIHRLGHPRNVALCKTPELACVYESVKHGRLYITDGPALGLTANGALPGDVLSALPNAAIDVTVEALAPVGGTLSLFVGHERVQRIDLPVNERSRQVLAIPMPSEDSFLRVEIEQPGPHGGPVLGLLSNPILLDVEPARASWR